MAEGTGGPGGAAVGGAQQPRLAGDVDVHDQ